MHNQWVLIGLSFLYLTLLFAVAYYGERRSRQGRSLVNNPYIYALSLAVYCSAWTYYGSVGLAAQSGIFFITVYLGPLLIIPTWGVLLRKIIRVSKVQRITSIADFISARYGKSATLGSLVALICVLGIVPYISLQLKAIVTSLEVLTEVSTHQGQPTPFLQDTAFYIAVVLAVFTILFGTRNIETTERHEGVVAAIALESLVKLLAFLTVGLYVTYGLFDGPGDIFRRAAAQPQLLSLFTLDAGGRMLEGAWFWHTLLSALAIVLLPRQFQVAVIENVNERHLHKAIWLFPLYLLLINLFVLPVAFGGRIFFEEQAVDADTFVLTLPMVQGNEFVTLFAYVGGFSAATSMVIVATIALSTMISNSLVVPLMIKGIRLRHLLAGETLLLIRWASTFLVLGLAYLYYKFIGNSYALVSIGLVSFAAIAQFAPSAIGGLFWKQATRTGALLGLGIGFLTWGYTSIVPLLARAGMWSGDILQHGPFGWHWLHPQALFGLSGMENVAHSVFWSLLLNVLAYVLGSFFSRQTAKEVNQAEVFVDIFRYGNIYESSLAWKGTAYVAALRTLLASFLGAVRTEQALASYAQQYNTSLHDAATADAKLVNYAEKLLAGVIGAASARVMVASVVQEESIQMNDVVEMLRESQYLLAYNKELKYKSTQLRKTTAQLMRTNERLQELDRQKDEFISTVTHEIRTPLTSLRALSEILYDNPDLPQAQRNRFLETIVGESERLSRLISQVLDLERFDSGKQAFHFEQLDIKQVIEQAVVQMEPLAAEKRVRLTSSITMTLPPVRADRDRLLQVLINLIFNAIKYCEPENGQIQITAFFMSDYLYVHVRDNGPGISPEHHRSIFERFQQVKGHTNLKPEGSGLGLAISKKIIEYHGGRIWVESQLGAGARFTISLPVRVRLPRHIKT